MNDLSIYDAAAAGWWSGDLRWVRTLRNMVPARLTYFDRMIDWRGASVLDLGCGGGFMAEALVDRGAIVTGIDPAPGAIAAASAHAYAGGLTITYDVGTGESLPYADRAFDAIVCVDVLEHVSDRACVLAEVARVLKPGGLFLFDTINRTPLARFAVITLAERVLRLLPRGTHDPAMFIKPDEMRSEIANAGLVAGRFVGLGPRGVNRRGDLVFDQLPGTSVIYMGTAHKS